MIMGSGINNREIISPFGVVNARLLCRDFGNYFGQENIILEREI